MKRIKFHIVHAFLIILGISGIAVNAQEVTIAPGGYITVKQSGDLYIGMDLLIQSVPDSSGYFVDHSSAGGLTVTGDITVERYMTADMWHNVASPVSDESSACFTGTDLVFWYNEVIILNDWDFGWVWYAGATGGPLMVFRGYDVYFATNPVTVNYFATGTETLNTGPYTITVTNTNSIPGDTITQRGWNLLGNPYPSPVDWLAAAGWDKSNIGDAKYTWDGTNNIYNIFLGGGSPIGINGGTRYIPSNQGFWVHSIVPSGPVGINNAARVGEMTDTPDFYKLEPIDYPMVSLVASGNNLSDEIIIRFLDGTTAGFDENYDASKLFSSSPDVPQISIKAGNQILALNSLPELKDSLEVLVNFQCGTDGYYNINLNKRTNLDHNIKVYLEDKLEQTITNMTADSAYGFFHETGNDKNRFKIFFILSSEIVDNITRESCFSVHAQKNIITILKNCLQPVSGEIYIYDMLGHPVLQKTLEDVDKLSFEVNIPNGYYIVSIVTEHYINNSKILIIN